MDAMAAFKSQFATDCIYKITVSDCCLTPNEQLFSYIMDRTSYMWQDVNDVLFVLDQQA